MDEIFEKIKPIDDLISDLTPSSAQRKRVENIIFSKSFAKQSNSSFLNSTNMKINSPKLYWSLGGLFVLGVFLGVPIVSLVFLGGSKTSNLQMPLDDIQQSASIKKKEMADEVVGQSAPGIGGERDFEYEPNTENMKMEPAPIFAERIQSDIASNYVIGGIKEDVTTPFNDRAQVREANISIQVENFERSYGELTNKVAGVGGYILNVSTSVNETESYTNMQVRLPVEQFDNFMNYLRGIGTVTSENISIQDKQSELTEVTKKISTSEARINELKSLNRLLTQEEKYELSNLQYQLDQYKQTEGNLRKQTEFSTVSVYMTTLSKPETWSVSQTWKQVVSTLEYIVKFWISAGMWALVPIVCLFPLVLLGLIIKLIVKRNKTEKEKK